MHSWLGLFRTKISHSLQSDKVSTNPTEHKWWLHVTKTWPPSLGTRDNVTEPPHLVHFLPSFLPSCLVGLMLVTSRRPLFEFILIAL
jgi:hypothetical protein